MRSDSVFDVLVNSVLAVDAVAADEFVGRRPAETFDRVYGGEIAAQGLSAAARTVDPRRAVHSLHVNFLRIGRPDELVHYHVEHLRESTHFSTRFVRARQADRTIATMTASFQAAWHGLDHSAPMSARPIPEPESLPNRRELALSVFGSELPSVAAITWPIDVRYIDRAPWAQPDPDAAPGNRMWVRADGILGDEQIEHAGVLTYASDLSMFEAVIYPYLDRPELISWVGMSDGSIRGASLDHSIWFHRPFRADEWLLHEHDSPAAFGSRGLTLGRYYNRDGQLVASVAQEMASLVDPTANGFRA